GLAQAARAAQDRGRQGGPGHQGGRHRAAGVIGVRAVMPAMAGSIGARHMPSGLPRAGFIVAALVAAAGPAVAQDYPSRPIRVVIPFAAGTGADIMGRSFAKGLQERAGQPAIVDNRPGNIGNLAPGLVRNAKPDGYTLLFASNSNMAFGIFLMKSPPFDTFRDFVAIHALAQN